MSKNGNKRVIWLPGLLAGFCWALLLGAFPPDSLAQGWPPPWQALGRMIAAQQSNSGIYRDHSSYQQKITLTRVEVEKGKWLETTRAKVRYTAETAPDVRGRVHMQMVALTDGEGKPLPEEMKDAGILCQAGFWEELFFPFYPEKLKRLEILEIEEAEENSTVMRVIHFAVREELTQVPAMEGWAYVSPATGGMLRLKLKDIQRLETLDPSGKGLTITRLDADYSSPEPGVRVPFSATLEGSSKAKPFRGGFHLRYQESAHTPVQDLPKP
jgi:hypothetical protein